MVRNAALFAYKIKAIRIRRILFLDHRLTSAMSVLKAIAFVAVLLVSPASSLDAGFSHFFPFHFFTFFLQIDLF